MKMTDQEFEALKASLNNAIHEIVFACQHMEDEEFEDAAQNLITAQDTLDRVILDPGARGPGRRNLITAQATLDRVGDELVKMGA